MDEPVFHQLSIDPIVHPNLDAEHAASLLRRFLTTAQRRDHRGRDRCRLPRRLALGRAPIATSFIPSWPESPQQVQV
jgi:hypothetical protein